ncbi:MAG: type III-A CRISPR-associated RAMP protein Csm4 [Nitrospirae bacterium RBG_13_39_12]|nr:MAG: type III-A CRISPR-associated RAMP protein Csm4 [Nitrospirae bacterium RBG_13_39_12]
MLLLVKLIFKRAFAVNSGEEESSGLIHSDTLFSSIVNEWVKMYPNRSIDDMVLSLNSEKPLFKISSAFPFFYGDYYLPTPIGTDELCREKLKDVPFLELHDFLELAEGNHEKIRKKTFGTKYDFIIPFVAPRVSVDRITTASNPYYISGWSMKEGGGLYFLVDLKDESVEDELLFCIKMLGETGIGADKSAGFGAFESEISPIDNISEWVELFEERNGDSTAYYSLSLCCPADSDEAKEALSYHILSRKGWTYSTSTPKQLKRRECRMFAEGSLFRKPIKGKVADVTPSGFKSVHNVYRYGLGMMVQMKMPYRHG